MEFPAPGSEATQECFLPTSGKMLTNPAAGELNTGNDMEVPVLPVKRRKTESTILNDKVTGVYTTEDDEVDEEIPSSPPRFPSLPESDDQDTEISALMRCKTEASALNDNFTSAYAAYVEDVDMEMDQDEDNPSSPSPTPEYAESDIYEDYPLPATRPRTQSQKPEGPGSFTTKKEDFRDARRFEILCDNREDGPAYGYETDTTRRRGRPGDWVREEQILKARAGATRRASGHGHDFDIYEDDVGVEEQDEEEERGRTLRRSPDRRHR